jgi:hypothetical protein
MKKIYLVLAVLGAVGPYVYFVQHFQAVGFGLGDFLSSLFVNGAAGGLSVDILVSSIVFWLFMASEKRTKRSWLYILINLSIGLSCALPLYLYHRESGET